MKEYKREPLFMKGDRAAWFAPSSLKDLLLLAAFYPDHSTTKYVVGNSEVGIEQRFARKHYPVLISPFHIEELKTFSANDQTLEIGSVLSLSDLWAALERHKSALVNDSSKAHQVRTIQAIIDQLRWFSGTSIRNTACLGGNIVTASPISDLNPVWIALDARFHLLKKKDGKHGKSDDIEERVVSARDFFHRGYRKTELRAEEVVAKVTVPLNEKHQYVRAYKQSRRREDDIAIVNAAISMKVDPATRQITNASLSFGGMAPFTTTAPNTEKYLNGKTWSENTLNEALKVMREEMLLGENTPGGMAEYRTALALSMLYKYWLDVSQQIGVELPPSYLSGARSLSEIDELPEATGNQVYQSSSSVVGRPAVHMSSERQVTGEAVFTDDVAPHPQELYASLVTSSHPYARVEGLDLSAIMEVDEEGRKKFLGTIKGVYTHRDVPGKNVHGDIVKDEELFASEIVSCVGQPIAVVVAENEHDARLAASKIKVKYAPVKKGHHINDDAIFSINEARAKNSFFPNEHTIRSWKGGDDKELEKQFQELSKGGKGAVVEGQIHIGGQEHFYFEPQVSIVYPLDTEFKVLSSTQNTFKTQKTVASVLGIPEHKVACSVRRIGGGFGGKETQNINFACCAAVAAYHQNRPVRLLLSRDEDMLYTGKRHPFQGNYKVGFTNDGKIQAMDVSLFNNGGNYHDLSWPVLDRALFHCDNSYYVPYLKATGRVCKTNLVSNTAFRGFGGPQGMMVAEACIEHVAHALKLPPHVVRERNLYNDDDVTHYGQKVDVRMKELWRQVMEVSQYEERWKEVEKFNRENRWKKRGMSVLPSKFGIAFTATFLNQGTAMVHVYTDGTVLITHGGVEMGQGLHTKVCQVAAHELGIPLKDVYISETASDKIPNASATAASMGSDLYGMATQMACRELKERLEPYRKKLGSSTSLADLATAAYFDRTSLTAQGFYKVPVSGFTFETREGTPFSYFTTGMAATEVEVDTLTGDWRSRRTDIVMDVGASLNPAVDIGQIEGAFVQGLGWSTIEELVWGDREHKWARPGYLKTNGPGAYKIPSADDIPRQLNVYLMRDSKNAKAVHSSRAIGEPPLFLGASCFWAIRHAIQAARADVGLGDEYFRLDSPLTGERIRMACWDHLLETTVGKEQAARYQREFLPKGSF
ncbi:xylitol dehydrogenase, variant 2 [Balamuthia mandrillaris]